jgi:hypothetical protein
MRIWYTNIYHCTWKCSSASCFLKHGGCLARSRTCLPFRSTWGRPSFLGVRVCHLFLVFHVQCVFVVVCLTCSQICLCPWISLRLELRFGWLSLTILSFTFWRFFFILDVWHLLFSYQNFVLFVCFYYFFVFLIYLICLLFYLITSIGHSQSESKLQNYS